MSDTISLLYIVNSNPKNKSDYHKLSKCVILIWNHIKQFNTCKVYPRILASSKIDMIVLEYIQY
jgi:hypothetical protein